MKKIVVLSILMVCVFAVHAQETISALISADESGLMPSIYNRPNGSVVMQLHPSESYVLSLTMPKKGWWKVISVYNEEDENDTRASLEGSDTGEYYIHYSVIGTTSKNDGGERLYLRKSPKAKAKVVYSFTEEYVILKPIDIKNGWVKVETEEGKVGWIEEEWLCASNLTNCS